MTPSEALSYAAKLLDPHHMEAQSNAEKLADLVEARAICRRVQTDLHDILLDAEREGETIPSVDEVFRARYGEST